MTDISSIKVLRAVKPRLRWLPVQGPFTTEFLESKANDANGPSYEDLTRGPDSVLQEAQRILGRCLPPADLKGAPETGLVVGYVQSGKTLSFETVIALARDNGFGLVIVLAGTKNNLRDQSEDRLRKDLGIEDGDHWYHLSNPKKPVKGQIETRVAAWKRRSSKKALLVTVLKHGGHIENLADVLESVDLAAVPCLIIDDESDQASLNTKAARIRAGRAAITEVSTTYGSILSLRAVLPHHSYLQYTATPQANLLLAQTDFLNPNFAELVTPGGAYTGGRSFFIENTGLLVDIPHQQVPGPDNELDSPPKTLLSALRYFLLAAAHHAVTQEKRLKPKDRNRSMMVHPAIATSSHKLYKKWVDRAVKALKSSLPRLANSNPSAAKATFEFEYKSLKETFPKIRPLSELVAAILEDVFDDLNVVEINGTKDAERKVNWKGTKYWILVGGAKLDRGYTVEGLCTTYMPRPLGTSPTADTLQQRARFFGYKAPYLGLCRVFLQRSVREAFEEYIEHEEFVRDALVANRGKPLRDWRRDFVLTQLLKPTRANVIGLGTRRIAANGWMVPMVMQRDAAAAQNNRSLLPRIIEKWEGAFGMAVNASAVMRSERASPHDVICDVPLKSVLEDFILDVQIRDPSDAEDHRAIIIALTSLLSKDPDLKADVFLMNRLVTGYRTRVAGRGFRADQMYAPINQYFSQSAGTLNDRDYCFSDRVGLQLRKFDLGIHQRDSGRADTKDVTWFAINVPRKLRKDLLIEERS
jgi:hypothetical protein